MMLGIMFRKEGLLLRMYEQGKEVHNECHIFTLDYQTQSKFRLPSTTPDIFSYGLFSIELSHKVLGVSPTRME